ncbi:fungal-specific transcription factor domain-containing protein [Poronia punctata]|nr:fungal-specific transcription factor domain-containing protein [Poronia punctata]
MPFKRTRTGCFTCRGDGYKCDEQKPICARCTRLGKECKGYGVRLKWQEPVNPESRNTPKETKAKETKQRKPPAARSKARQTQHGQHVKPIEPTGVVLPVPRAVGSKLAPRHAYLLDHWSTTLASVITMAPTARNPFHAHVTPIICHSPALQSAVCFMAACHLGTLKADASLLNIGTYYQTNAIASLRQSIATETPIVSLATILILQITDRLFTTSSGVNHLEGAKVMIKRAGPKALDCELGRFLLSLCCHHDAVISVSRREAPIIGLGADVGPTEGMEPMRGLKVLWATIGQISRMCGQDGATCDREGVAIIHTLQGLDRFASRQGDVGHTIHAYKEATYIYLHRVWHEVGSPHPKALKHARDCLSHLFQVPVSSPLCASHVWPLWTAACETIDHSLRDQVRERIKVMFEVRHLPSLQRLQADIEHVWRVKDEELKLTGVDRADCIRVILANRQREADLV